MLRRVEHDLAAVVRHRRPAVREPAHVVLLRRLEPAGAERAAGGRQVRAVLARVDDERARTPVQLVGAQVGCRVDGAHATAPASRPAGPRNGRDHDALDVLADRGARVGVEAGVGDEDVDLLEAGDPAQAADAPLRVVGDDDDPRRRGDERAVGLGLEQVRRREAGVGAHAVHAEEEHVEVQRADRRRARSGRRARPTACARRPSARPSGRAARSRCSTFATWIEFVTTVRSGTCEQVVREAPGRRAGGEADRLAGLDERGAPRARSPPSPSSWRCDFASNPGSSALRPPRSVAPPCTFSSEPGRGERVEIAADRHLRDARAAPVSSLTRTAPWRRSSSTISLWRWAASMAPSRSESHNTQPYRTAAVKSNRSARFAETA